MPNNTFHAVYLSASNLISYSRVHVYVYVHK